MSWDYFLSEKLLNSCSDEFFIGNIAEPLHCGYTLEGFIPCNDICNNVLQIPSKEFRIMDRENMRDHFYMETRLYPFLFKNVVYFVSRIANLYKLSNQGNFGSKD